MDFLFRAAESSGGILGFTGTLQNNPNVADGGSYIQALPLAVQRAESCSNYFADPILYFAKSPFGLVPISSELTKYSSYSSSFVILVSTIK